MIDQNLVRATSIESAMEEEWLFLQKIHSYSFFCVNLEANIHIHIGVFGLLGEGE